MSDPNDYFPRMPRKPIELPPAIARAFVNDMRAFLAEKNAIKRDEIAARQRERDVSADEGSRLTRVAISIDCFL
jgi:hypothetical protein